MIKAVDDEAESQDDRRREVGAGWRREVVGGMAGLNCRVRSQISAWERDHPGVSREGFAAVITPSNETVRQWWQKPNPCEKERSPQS